MLALAAYGQNFTNSVERSVGKHFTDVYFLPANNFSISSPLSVFIDFEGSTPHFLSVSLKHQGTEVSIFSRPAAESPMVSLPFTNFEGLSQGGAWILKIDAKPAFCVKDWGISSIPEPSTWYFLIVGFCCLIVFGMNKCKI
jgi:hypothetical protein